MLLRQGEFQTGHQTKLYIEKMRASRVCVALKTIYLLYLHKYQLR